jgi:hypothetical protein
MTARLSRTLCLSFAGLFVWACADLRDDGFTSQITHRCATPKGCDEALKDAKARVDKCPDATSSECLAVKEDLASVERLNKRHQDEAKAREEQAKKVDEALAKARAQEEASRANAKTLEEQVTGHAADLRTALADCRATADYTKCENGKPTPAEKAECETSCKQFGAQRSEDLFRLMLRACAETAESDPKHTKCLVDGRVWSPRGREEECSKKCASLAAKVKTWMSAKVKCCDGSPAPKCKNAELRTDCCEGHNGICPEPKPQEP